MSPKGCGLFSAYFTFSDKRVLSETGTGNAHHPGAAGTSFDCSSHMKAPRLDLVGATA